MGGGTLVEPAGLDQAGLIGDDDELGAVAGVQLMDGTVIACDVALVGAVTLLRRRDV